VRALCALATIAASGAACDGQTGTLAVTLTQAPGSTLLDSVQTLRMTVTNPRQTFTAERTSSGFSISLELEATGDVTALLVEGLDASGTLVANGASPTFPTGALSGRIVIYMAPPLSVGAAPLSLTPPRSEVGAGTLPYGVIFAGGRLDTGAPTDAITIYNAFDHSLVSGKEMPAPRAGVALAVGTGRIAYLFGGTDESNTVTANLWRFDTTTAPNGSWIDFGTKDGFARANEVALPIGADHFLITGMPAAELEALNGVIVARDEVAALPTAGVSLTANDGMQTTIFAGPDGVVRYRNGTFTPLDIPSAARAGASVVALPGGKALVVCGSTEAVRIDAATGTADMFSGIPRFAKTGCAVAATSRHLIIAGGSIGGTIDPTVDIYDAATLTWLAGASLVAPRAGGVAMPLPNDQILIGSGVDAAGAPVGTLELFTPPIE
jgi:hypothetical protein